MTRSVNHVERFREAVAEGRPAVGTSIGFDPDTVRDWFAKGVQWFALGDTTSHIGEGTAAVVQGVRDLGLSRQS